MLAASEELPMPTGKEVEIKASSNGTDPAIFFEKYGSLFTIRPEIDLRTSEPTGEVSITLNLNSPEDIRLLGRMLKETTVLLKPENRSWRGYLNKYLWANDSRINIQTEEQFNDIFVKLKEIIDDHNLYLDNISESRLEHIINNSIIYNTYNSIIDPVNLIQAQTSVDGTIKPFKDIGKLSKEAQDALYRTPGDFITRYKGIKDNAVGKDCVGISASSLKAFLALTQYCNMILNNGTTEQQERLLTGNDHEGIFFKGRYYKTLANIRSKDPNTILNANLFDALSEVANDEDAVLLLSSILSLSVDNAKELELSKLNINTKTIGLYIYGISVGIPFAQLAQVLMSDAGIMLTSIMDSNVFDGTSNASDVLSVLRYFQKLPNKVLNKFDKKFNEKGERRPSPLDVFKQKFNAELESLGVRYINSENKLVTYFNEKIARFATDKSSTRTLQDKLGILENIRKSTILESKQDQELFNQLIDVFEDYMIQASVVIKDDTFLPSIATLAHGSDEFAKLRRILGINQGLRTSRNELVQQVNNIEKLIYDITKNPEDLIDIVRFVNDEEYRNKKILEYEKHKHSFNILDIVSTVPHYFGYLKSLASDVQANMQSFSFRNARRNVIPLNEILNNKSSSYELKLIDGVYEYTNDYLRQNWMLSKNIVFTIPAGNSIVTREGKEQVVDKDTDIKLGTDWGDASFRLFMENQVIPDLMKGKVHPNLSLSSVKENPFIRSLINDELSKTISRNATTVYTLPINMSPRNDQEIALRDSYRAEFNKLARFNYQYTVTDYDQDGNPVSKLSQSVPITDLFTYYALIAFRGKIGENSLMSMLHNFQNTGILQEFHDYVAEMDRSGETLDLSNDSDILYYITPISNPYSAYTEYIWGTNKGNRKHILMRRLSPDEMQEIQASGDFSGIMGRYTFLESPESTLLTRGSIQSSEVIHSGIIYNKKDKIYYTVKYDRETRKLNEVLVSTQNEPLDIQIDNVMKKLDKREVLDIDTLEAKIKNKLFPC